MINDLRFAFRMIATHRWFSAAVIFTLALGIGINTTVFTLVNAVLFKPVPIPGGERLVTVINQNLTQANSRDNISYPDFREYKTQNRTFEGLEAATNGQAILSERDNPPARYNFARISSGMFGMVHTPPIFGRSFSPADDKPGAEPVILIGYDVWMRRYAGAPDVVGRVVRVNGTPATIVGVMPEGFKFPSAEEVWMPLAPTEELEKRSNRWLQLFGILKPGISIDVAARDLAPIGSRLAKTFPDTNKDFSPLVRTFHDTYNGDQIRLLFLLMLGAVGFVLLIACANVANMMLSRAITRSREISMRAALGASRWQLVRQLLIESMLLSCIGGLLGLALSTIGVHAFDVATQAPEIGKPYWVLFTMDYRAFGYFAGLSVLSGVVAGLVPAWRASRVDLNTALKDGAASGGSHGSGRLTGALVVLQFALTVVLLAGAGMMVRSFFAAGSMNSFVPAEHIFTARLQLPEAKGERYADGETKGKLLRELIPQLAALPGVTRAASASFLPGAGSSRHDIELADRPNTDPKLTPHASVVVQTPDYLPTIGLPILLGRGFEEADGGKAKEAAVVTRSFANQYWPNELAVGKRFRFIQEGKPGEWMTVIGISADIVQSPQEPDAPPLVFIPHRQEPWGWMALLLRTSGDPTALAGAVRATVQKLDADLPLSEVATLPAALDRQRWYLRVFGSLFFTFAAIGLLMASVGIYAVVAQSTARRTREIGIRMALGSTAAGILRLVLSRGLTQLLLGLVLGLVGAFGATRVLAQNGFLFLISPNDPLVFVAITGLLIAIGAFACWLPARRAAALHPVKALRCE
jgi:putative ABC transport system permease protein